MRTPVLHPAVILTGLTHQGRLVPKTDHLASLQRLLASMRVSTGSPHSLQVTERQLQGDSSQASEPTRPISLPASPASVPSETRQFCQTCTLPDRHYALPAGLKPGQIRGQRDGRRSQITRAHSPPANHFLYKIRGLTRGTQRASHAR